MTRRRFLLLFLGAGLFITVASGLAHRYRRWLYRRYLQLRLDEFSPKGLLSSEDFRVIRALFETIAPQPAPSSAELLEFVTWRTSTVGGYYREYKPAIRLLESKAHAEGFASLNQPTRNAVLRGVLPRHTFLPLQEGLPYHESEPSLLGKIRVAWELSFFNEAARFKYFVLWDLLSFYWLSSHGWAAVGYSPYPGVPDPQRTYTTALTHIRPLYPEPPPDLSRCCQARLEGRTDGPMSATRDVEVCVIGGGGAGALLALQLSRAGGEVLILESGPWHDPGKRFDYMKQQLYGGDPWASNNPERDRFTLGGPYRWYDLNRTRVKAVGGSGLHWGGHTGRLHESDFELHARYAMGVDWPLRYRDLEPYYSEAEKIIGVAGDDAYQLTPWRSENYPRPPFPFSYSDHIVKRAFARLGIPLHHTAVARNSTPYDDRSRCAEPVNKNETASHRV